MEEKRIKTILNNLIIYMHSVDVISDTEKEHMLRGFFGGVTEINTSKKLHDCFDIIKERCPFAMTEKQFYDVLNLEVGITEKELDKLKEMKISYSDVPVMVYPDFI